LPRLTVDCHQDQTPYFWKYSSLSSRENHKTAAKNQQEFSLTDWIYPANDLSCQAAQGYQDKPAMIGHFWICSRHRTQQFIGSCQGIINQWGGTMSEYHEPAEQLSEETKNFSRALNSLKEEIEAINWYQQRYDVTQDEELKNLLAHNRDEEIEHACMALEWLRRNMSGWDKELRTYLFQQGDLALLEENQDSEVEGQSHDVSSQKSNDLNIGKIKF
jgi:hypothetical protein